MRPNGTQETKNSNKDYFVGGRWAFLLWHFTRFGIRVIRTQHRNVSNKGTEAQSKLLWILLLHIWVLHLARPALSSLHMLGNTNNSVQSLTERVLYPIDSIFVWILQYLPTFIQLNCSSLSRSSAQPVLSFLLQIYYM